MSRSRRPRDRDAFEIAVICALELESNAVEGVFDEVWEGDNGFGKARGDHNTYTTGRIGFNNVVLVYMPGMGKVESASVTAGSLRSFPNIKLGLVVGICGAVPVPPRGRAIFLGDVIISTGVEQYDLGRRFRHGLRIKDTLDDKLGRSTREIRSFLKKLRGLHGGERLRMDTLSNLNELWQDKNFDSYRYPGADADVLFQPEVLHKHSDQDCECAEEKDVICDRAREMSCAELNCGGELHPGRQRSSLVGLTDEDSPPAPMIHFGKIASGDQVILDAVFRDQSSRETGAIAFEMEGAGVWDNFPTIIIKGVCDYADSHKNKSWQSYAAAVAAASMKAFMSQWVSSDSNVLGMMPTTPAEEDHVTELDARRQGTPLRGDGLPHEFFQPNLDLEDDEGPYHTENESFALPGLQHRFSSRLWHLRHLISAKPMFTVSLVLGTLVLVASILIPSQIGSSSHSAVLRNEDINSNYPIFAVIGVTGVGKSSFISLLGGVNASDAPPEVSPGLEPCTGDVGLYMATIDQKPIYLMDTPGFDDKKLSDKEVLQQIYEKLQMLSRGDKLIKGMIYLHDMRQTRIGGLAARQFRAFEHILGVGRFENFVFVTTRWLRNPSETESQQQLEREEELKRKYWYKMIGQGSQVMRHDNSKESARLIVMSLMYRPKINLAGNFLERLNTLYNVSLTDVEENEEEPQNNEGHLGDQGRVAGKVRILDKVLWTAVRTMFVLLVVVVTFNVVVLQQGSHVWIGLAMLCFAGLCLAGLWYRHPILSASILLLDFSVLVLFVAFILDFLRGTSDADGSAALVILLFLSLFLAWGARLSYLAYSDGLWQHTSEMYYF